VKTTFIERTLGGLLAASEYSAGAERLAAAGGALQKVDPRVKLAGLFGLITVVVSSHQLRVIGTVFALALALAALSRLRWGRLAKWVWLPVLFFTGSIAFPSLFLTSGASLITVLGISVTESGLRSAAFLIARAETAATLSALLVLTTPWPWVLKALRTFKCPIVVVAILGMTYRYIFVMLQIASEMLESRRSRAVGVLPPSDRRRLAAATVGVLLSKSIQLSGDVHLAMRSRGFSGELYLLHEFRASLRDRLWLAGFAILIAGGFWWGRGL
jgi:cobalt ECF transporter T component CbiQ